MLHIDMYAILLTLIKHLFSSTKHSIFVTFLKSSKTPQQFDPKLS